ncbi:MAG: FkbM family methyltransferase [Deltaproteobacteria bacterium]|nr:FkbM family methyltransferase [Deltaproteobacteria bacterium]
MLSIRHKVAAFLEKTAQVSVEKKPPAAASVLLKQEQGRDLYKTVDGHLFWLNPGKYLDREIIERGVFEKSSTELVKKIVKKGDVILDVGANIGYYSVILSKLAGPQGKVYAFEPTLHYRRELQENLRENHITNCEILNYGLSDKRQELLINIGDSSATIHWVADTAPVKTELIKLETLDAFCELKKISRIDFIKIDIDGHEPHFLQGAWRSLERYNPLILLEVNHENYLQANVTAWDFYTLLKEKGYYIYSEDALSEITTKREFLIKCGNFAYSANVLLSKEKLILSQESNCQEAVLTGRI